jgi:hypothetical protein
MVFMELVNTINQENCIDGRIKEILCMAQYESYNKEMDPQYSSYVLTQLLHLSSHKHARTLAFLERRGMMQYLFLTN